MSENIEKPSQNEVSGVVIEALPNALFRVEMGDGSVVMAYLAGKMRMNHIRVILGDKVKMVLDPYGGKGRIIKRL
jgi:translation initiation factor IF-1